MADLELLRRRFPQPGISFGMTKELAYVRVETAAAKATIYLQGAHLTDWQPAGFEPVIFVSRISEYAVGKAIRGGVPIVFPWFAGDRKKDRVDGHPGPSHGFAKTEEWELALVEMTGDGVRVVFTLGPTAESRSMGFNAFHLKLEFVIGHELKMAMTVENKGAGALRLEEAFHSFYKVADIHEVTVSGLEGKSFIDKTDEMKVKTGELIRFMGTVDRVYNDVTGATLIRDVAGRRRITVEKGGSSSTIVWNPGKPVADIDEWGWHEMVAVETGNVGTNEVELAPGASHTMSKRVRVQSGA